MNIYKYEGVSDVIGVPAVCIVAALTLPEAEKMIREEMKLPKQGPIEISCISLAEPKVIFSAK